MILSLPSAGSSFLFTVACTRGGSGGVWICTSCVESAEVWLTAGVLDEVAGVTEVRGGIGMLNWFNTTCVFKWDHMSR